MKTNVDPKLLLGLVIGGAIGAAVGYLTATDKKEIILEELNEVAGKIKDGINTAITKFKEQKAECSAKIAESQSDK